MNQTSKEGSDQQPQQAAAAKNSTNNPKLLANDLSTKQTHHQQRHSGVKSTESLRAKQLSDQQVYYLNKINKTKSKLDAYGENGGDDVAHHLVDSFDQLDIATNNKTAQAVAAATRQKYHSSNSDYDTNYGQERDRATADRSDLDFENKNNNIDTLLSNALEISRTYRRMNSSAINGFGGVSVGGRESSSAAYNLLRGAHGNKKRMPTTVMVAEQRNQLEAGTSAILPNLNELHETSHQLLAEYKSIKVKQEQEQQPLSVETASNTGTVQPPLPSHTKSYVSPMNGAVDEASNKSQQSVKSQAGQFTTATASSGSPHTTMIAAATAVIAAAQGQSAPLEALAPVAADFPVVSTRTLVAANRVAAAITVPHGTVGVEEDDTDDNDKEIEDDNISEIISEDSDFDEDRRRRQQQLHQHQQQQRPSLTDKFRSAGVVSSSGGGGQFAQPVSLATTQKDGEYEYDEDAGDEDEEEENDNGEQEEDHNDDSDDAQGHEDDDF